MVLSTAALPEAMLPPRLTSKVDATRQRDGAWKRREQNMASMRSKHVRARVWQRGAGQRSFPKGPPACCRQAEALYWVMYYWVTVLLVFGCKIRERGSVSSFSPPFPAAAAAAALSATTVDNCTLHAAAPCLLSAQTAMDAS